MSTYLVIREIASGDEVKRSDVSDRSEGAQDKLVRGYMLRTDLDKFEVELVEVES